MCMKVKSFQNNFSKTLEVNTEPVSSRLRMVYEIFSQVRLQIKASIKTKKCSVQRCCLFILADFTGLLALPTWDFNKTCKSQSKYNQLALLSTTAGNGVPDIFILKGHLQKLLLIQYMAFESFYNRSSGIPLFVSTRHIKNSFNLDCSSIYLKLICTITEPNQQQLLHKSQLWIQTTSHRCTDHLCVLTSMAFTFTIKFVCPLDEGQRSFFTTYIKPHFELPSHR